MGQMTLAPESAAHETSLTAGGKGHATTMVDEPSVLCADAPAFDLDVFLADNDLTDEYARVTAETGAFYHLWELAERASIGDFAARDQDGLVLNLVCLGGFAPAETEYAVRARHADFIVASRRPFSICDFVTSGYGMTYCASREQEMLRVQMSERMWLARVRPAESEPEDRDRLAGIFLDFARDFVSGLECHDGSGRAMWELQSVSFHADRFVVWTRSSVMYPEPVPGEQAERVLARQAALEQRLAAEIQGFEEKEGDDLWSARRRDLPGVLASWDRFEARIGPELARIAGNPDQAYWRHRLAVLKNRMLVAAIHTPC
ncbi:hypothetical protein [Minwuia sp.]|uniref:hypothetical protein n=1 Tax=Minwuia sp. TaxID=2493630 RepID=UPI003A8FAA4F